MLIRDGIDPRASEITPERDYLNRRHFLGVVGSIGGLTAAGALTEAVMGTVLPAGA